MKTYRLTYNWEISFPSDWKGEYDDDGEQFVFYPPDSDLTVRVTPFQALKRGKFAPKEVMRDSFLSSLSDAATPLDMEECAIPGFEWAAFEDVETENSQEIYVAGMGIFGSGLLLVVDIYSENQAECRESLQYIKKHISR